MALHYFGTDGVRGKAGEDLTVGMAYRIGRFIGQYPEGKQNKILISRDTRLSGSDLLEALIEGIVKSGGIVYDEGVSTTPSVSYLIKKCGFDYGIMISASHNPYYDNGIKIFNGEGEKLCDEIEELIEAYMDAKEDDLPIKEGKKEDGSALKGIYIDWLVSKASSKCKGLRVIADLANGSSTAVAPILFPKLGLEATFLANEPDGVNINRGCGSTHLDNLLNAFDEGKYDLGFAFDGDADRFMAVCKGKRVIDGDALIFLSALHLRKDGRLHDNKVVITVMSNFGLRKALDEEGIGYDIVTVGDKYVQARLKEKDLSVGGEQSGHVIFLADLNTGDGLLSAIKLLNIFCKDEETFAKLPNCKVYPQKLSNVRVSSRQKMEEILASDAVKGEIAKQEKRLGDSGRILVRCSGTEPLIRVMAEALDKAECDDAVDQIVAQVNAQI